MDKRLRKLWWRWKKIRREKESLNSMHLNLSKADSLRRIGPNHLIDIFRSREIIQDWQTTVTELDHVCRIKDGQTWGVNPGDRRAIFFLVDSICPNSVLEIGTHVGASTVHIAAALKSLMGRNASFHPTLTTVDIQDVNHPVSGFWKQMGLAMSPAEVIKALDCSDMVDFVTDDSLHYLQSCAEKFDFIFLDGDHSAKVVYQEINFALSCLNPDGVILLHDYFPKNRPLWPDQAIVPGPFVATQKLRSDGVGVYGLPLGQLPWETKKASNITSLALLVS